MKLTEKEKTLIETVRVYRAIKRQAKRTGMQGWREYHEAVYVLVQSDLGEALSEITEQ